MIDQAGALAFDASRAYGQAGLLLIGFFTMVAGMGPIAWYFSMKSKGVRVRARVVAVKVRAKKQQPFRMTGTGVFAKDAPRGKAYYFFGKVVPLLLLLAALWYGGNYFLLVATGVKTESNWIGSVEIDDAYFTVVEFFSADGGRHKVRENFGRGGRQKYADGEKLVVHYAKNDPSRAVFGGFWRNMILPLFSLAWAVLLYALIVGFPQRAERARKRGEPDYSREEYYPVYEYANAEGAVVQAELPMGMPWIADRIPGSAEIDLYINRDEPDFVLQVSCLSLYGGLFFVAVGLAWIAFASQTGFNAFTFIFLAAAFLLILGGGKRLFILDKKKKSKPKNPVKKRAPIVSGDPMPRHRDKGRLLSEEETYNRLWRQDRTARLWQLGLALAAAAAMTFGYYQGRDMAVLVSEGERVQGTVTRMNSRIERTDEGSQIFYSPVFTFTAHSGSTHRLEDKGSTMPIFRIGDSATILYHPRNPENAIVDQGLLNWTLSGGFFLGGLVVLGAVIKSYAGVRRRARMLKEIKFRPERV